MELLVVPVVIAYLVGVGMTAAVARELGREVAPWTFGAALATPLVALVALAALGRERQG